MAIPLNYLKQVIDASGTFNYTIQVNGLNTGGTAIVVGMDINNPQQTPADHNSSQFLFSPTYFKGAYTLAKQN